MTRAPRPHRDTYTKYRANPANRVKVRAREICAHAIHAGKLTRQPCETCGAKKTEAHHEDYSKPLAVQWLCKPCHAVVHRKSHCVKGHPLTDENVFVTDVGRQCRLCRRDYRSKKNRPSLSPSAQ